MCDISVAHTDDDVIRFDVVTTHHRHSDETQLHISLYIFAVFEVHVLSLKVAMLYLYARK